MILADRCTFCNSVAHTGVCPPTDTIFSADGSVYMTFPPVTPRVETTPYLVRRLTTTDALPPLPGLAGTSWSVQSQTRQSFRDVARLRSDISRQYGPYVSHWAVTLTDGRRVYRYSWERLDAVQGRLTTVLWLTRDA